MPPPPPRFPPRCEKRGHNKGTCGKKRKVHSGGNAGDDARPAGGANKRRPMRGGEFAGLHDPYPHQAACAYAGLHDPARPCVARAEADPHVPHIPARLRQLPPPVEIMRAKELLRQVRPPSFATLTAAKPAVEKRWNHAVVLVLVHAAPCNKWRTTTIENYARDLYVMSGTKIMIHVINNVRKDIQGDLWFTMYGAGTTLFSPRQVLKADAGNSYHRTFLTSLDRLRCLARPGGRNVVETTVAALDLVHDAISHWKTACLLNVLPAENDVYEEKRMVYKYFTAAAKSV